MLSFLVILGSDLLLDLDWEIEAICCCKSKITFPSKVNILKNLMDV